MRVLWVLAFDDDLKRQLVEIGIVDLIRPFQVGDNEQTKQAIDGALWVLVGPSSVSAPSIPNSDQLPYVMISYSWAQKSRMRQLAEFLKTQSIPIWLDVEQMEGSVLEKMAEAVENAGVVIIGLSSQYKESQACRTEAEYAYKLKKHVVCLMVEDGYQLRGWLGALLGNKLWYNPWGEGKFETGMLDIVKQIKKALNISNALPPPVTSSASSLSLTTSVTSSSTPTLAATVNGDEIYKWKIEQVTEWLKKANLDELAKTATEGGWNGRVLEGLNDSRESPNFIPFCVGLGLEKTILHIRLKVELKRLFS